jgi:hypothetical protein
VTKINSDVVTADVLPADVLPADVLAAEPWRARLGAFSPRSAFPGTSVPGAGGGTGPCVVVRSVPRVRDQVSLGSGPMALPVPQPAVAAPFGQTNNYNHMTSVYAIGEGASGPPPYREPV